MSTMFDWKFAGSILPELARAFETTLIASAAGFLIALALGLCWALLRRSHQGYIARPIGFVVEFVRSTPLLVQLFFLFYVLPDSGVHLSPLATGILALGIHYSAYAAEVYRAGIESVPKGQWDAARALNFSRARTWRAVLLPQAIPPILPALGNYAVAMFKDSVLLAAITVSEVLQSARLIGSETFRYLEPLTLVGLLFLAASLLCAWLLSRLEARVAGPKAVRL